MQLKKILHSLLLISYLSCSHFLKASSDISQIPNEKSNFTKTLIPGFYFKADEWKEVERNPYLRSFRNKDGLSQVHLGVKPFFESVVPTAEELHRTFFQNLASSAALDWNILGIQPGDQRLHKPQLVAVWKNCKVALDIIPIFVNSQKLHYAVATFVYRNYPIYFTSKHINDRNTLETHLTSTFRLD